MSGQTHLSDRKQQILKAVIELYVDSALPVGSGHVVREHVTGISSATVRNEMVELEQAGLLFQPHTSAGRVPSEQGFRYFVQQLMEERSLATKTQVAIRHQLNAAQLAREEWLNVAATTLAQAAHAAGIVTAPLPTQCRIKHFELLAIQERVGLLVVVLQEGTVKQQVIELPGETSQTALSAACTRLNEAIRGLGRSEIEASAEPMSDLEGLIVARLTDLMDQIDQRQQPEIRHAGLVELLREPEFQQPAEAQRLVQVLDRPEHLLALLPAFPWPQGMHVLIGGEGAHTAILRDLSMVVAYYGVEEMTGGFVGVLGPLRLDYAEAIPAVRFVAGVMTDLLTDQLGAAVQ